MPFHIVLYEPEIPANTGNIVRTCAATGTILHLIHPLGFSIEDKYLKRAGLDYWNDVTIAHYDSYEHFIRQKGDGTMYFVETSGKVNYTEPSYQEGDYFVFGKETAGIPDHILEENKKRIVRIPMIPGTRSLNLSNSAAVVLYEALRQNGFRDFM